MKTELEKRLEEYQYEIEDLGADPKEVFKNIVEITEKLDEKINECNQDPKFANTAMPSYLPVRKPESQYEWPKWSSDGYFNWSIAYEIGKTDSSGDILLLYYVAPQKYLETRQNEEIKQAITKRWRTANLKIDLLRGIFEIERSGKTIVSNSYTEVLLSFCEKIDSIAESRKK